MMPATAVPFQRLLNKVKTERTVTDAPAAAAIKSVELQRLESIIGAFRR